MKRGFRLVAAIAVAAVVAFAAAFWAGPASRLPLGEDLARATVALDAGTREALVPEFPSRLSFDVTIPESAYLDLSPALVMESEVPRARVEFRVELEVEGSGTEPVLLYSRFVDVSDANLWHDQRFDLSPWEGRAARIVLEARSDPPRESVLWSDRVQVAWAEPVLVSDPQGRALETLSREASRFGVSLELQAARAGVSVEDRIQLRDFGINLVLAGLFAVALARVMGSKVSSLVPLLALATTLVIAVVHLSVPLSLGLIGALSILRFRTAIPRGRDLAYLSAAVAVGLALGAGERLVAAVGGAVLAGILYLVGRARPLSKRVGTRRLDLVLPADGFDAFRRLGLAGELREVDLGAEEARVSMVLEPDEEELALLAELWRKFPEARVTWSRPSPATRRPS